MYKNLTIVKLKKKIISKSYGKIIIAGEHAVVYGKPAIILPIDRWCEVAISETVRRWDSKMVEKKYLIKNIEKDSHKLIKYVVENFLKKFKIALRENIVIKINSNIPVGMGFGSSAAVITALIKALYEYFVGDDPCVVPKNWDKHGGLSLQKLLDFCISCENLIHKKSSGADIYASWFGKPILFQNINGKAEYKILNFNGSDNSRVVTTKYIIVDTGKPIESTGEMVQQVKKLKLKDKSFFQKNIDLIGHEVEKVINKYREINIFKTIDTIEICLENLGIVSEKTMKFIHELNSKNIFAKICGAGGKKKGSGVAIVFTNDKKTVESVCLKFDYKILEIKIKI